MSTRETEVLVIGAGPGAGRVWLASLAPACWPDDASAPCPAPTNGGDF